MLVGKLKIRLYEYLQVSITFEFSIKHPWDVPRNIQV